MKWKLFIKILLIIMLIIILLPVIIFGLFLRFIFSLFSKEKTIFDNITDELVDKISKELKQGVMVDFEEEVLSIDPEIFLLNNMIDLILKEELEIKIKGRDLEKLQKDVYKEMSKDYKIRNLTINRLKELTITFVSSELSKDDNIEFTIENKQNKNIEQLLSNKQDKNITIDTQKSATVEEENIISKDKKEHGIKFSDSLPKAENGVIITQKEENIPNASKKQKDDVNNIPLNIEDNKDEVINIPLYNEDNKGEIVYSYKRAIESVADEVLDTLVSDVIELKAVDTAMEILSEKSVETDEKVTSLEKLAMEDAKTKEEIVRYNNVYFHQIDNEILFLHQIENHKEDIEDRDYGKVDLITNNEILRIERLQLVDNIDSHTQDKLNSYLKRLYELKDDNLKCKDESEESYKIDLKANVSEEDKYVHDSILNKSKEENLIFLRGYGLGKVEEITLHDKAKELEKELIIKKLSKIENTNSIFNRFKNFIKSKIFRNYSENKLIQKEIGFLGEIVTNKTVDENVSLVPNSNYDVTECDKTLCEDNIRSMSNIHMMTQDKHPELSHDLSYISKVNRVGKILDKKLEKSKKKISFREKILSKGPRGRVRVR